MSAVNAFNWKEFTDEEHARRGDPFADIKRNAKISAKVTEGIHRIRETKPSHGTIFGITEGNVSTRAPDMMGKGFGFQLGNKFGRGGARGGGRRLPLFDERRAMSMFSEGLTKKEIAERLDIPYKSMLTFFRKAGKITTR